ncbi:FkbM family methyltransferase [Nostocaceae cyanobacterium CENA357]|uniref:FkbM family methyltransferase n=1 Tax=Atlanticothrix silvestris CENA357 TaxID=1725252 RepID=A0A8J7HIQ4_9CYAN|nr:FkbM family methyltransferase [Atlanticothrix silvestris]MBH8556283.1 FkbM family methyltransferase [Atlanticothrix silvestris CENA357]
MNNDISNSELNRLIYPEIKNDEFYAAIQRIAREEDIKTVLEIGSSSGEGSTEAFVTGLRENPNKPTLFCMEVSITRFAELKKRYENESFVKPYNVSSVPVGSFPDKKQVVDFYNYTQNNLKFYPIETVIGWLRQDVEYIRQSGVFDNGIQKIKQENNIDFFDLVLIDGSEFTGSAELDEVYGAKFICLDDITTFKNYNNHQKLLADPNYVLLEQNNAIRNGYSIFHKSERIENYFSSHEISEQLLVSKLVRPGMLVFDVGANIGDYSILLSKLVGSSGKVYSFEPTIITFNKLQERLSKSKCNNVYPLQNAVYSHNIQIEFNEFSEDFSAWNSIGRPQMLDPQGSGQYVPIVNTGVVQAITLDSFCNDNNIQKIDYLKVDVEGAESDVLQGAIELLKNKAIYFIQFEISQKMLEGLNRKAKSTFDILIENGYECHLIKQNGDIGEEVTDSNSFYENYIAFPRVPIHFFTIVLNGQPFIQYHIEVFKQLPFKWHWHIVEGVADFKHESIMFFQNGGCITDEVHNQGFSNDGTKEYLDELAKLYPENITVYRKSEGIFWDGHLEMVNAPLTNIHEECLLWQVDVDELWTLKQLCAAREMFINQPDKTAAFYWCWYFVGENLVISTRHCYAQNPKQEWLRTWKFKPGLVWACHSPPILVEPLLDNQWIDIARINPFLHKETEKENLVFQHFSYVLAKQVRFKELYYGYKDGVSQWTALQQYNKFPVLLGQFLGWVKDNTQVDTATSMGIVPIAQRELSSNNWKFLQLDEVKEKITHIKKSTLTIVIDGVFFQLYQTGIARVWKSLLEEWSNNGFAKHIVVLDRAGTAPKIPGIRYRTVEHYDYKNTNLDREMLQQVCDEEGVDLFISSYYTTPTTTPSVFMAYDMIPEVMGWDMNNPMWQEKHQGIQHASAYIAISEHTAHDLTNCFSDISKESVTVAYCGVSNTFSPAESQDINAFKNKYGITKPYFLSVGGGSGYKNSVLFFKAFSQLASSSGFDIVCTGSSGLLVPEFRAYTSGSTVQMLQLSDEELAIAYSGAVALVYPSKYEGFGMPVIEAMACGCPVITCPNASIPEVAGEAAIYINDDDVNGLANALCEVQKPSVRKSLIAAGLAQAQKFSWSKMAEIVSSALIDATLLNLSLKEINLIIFPDWSQPEELISLELELVIKTLATHAESEKTTLLIDTSDIAVEDAELFLSSVTMNFLMQEDLDITEGLKISLVGDLAEIQWETLLSRINARIIVEHENQQALMQAKAENLASYEIESFSQARDEQFFFA